MTTRRLDKLVPAVEITEGAGVSVHRTIGTPALRSLDPFLMLDHFGSENPDDYIAGFPDHPHRGFVTFTYMLDGHMEHRDSMGNRGDLLAGGAQWMKAGSGVIHSEMPKQSAGRMRGFQLWINLPRAEKMSDPAYQEFSPEAVPEVAAEGVRVRLLAGRHAGRRGLIEDPNTDALYLDVTLAAGKGFAEDLPAEHAAFVYVFEGDASLGEAALPLHHLAVLTPGDRVEVAAGPQGARFILVAGRPLNEPFVQYGPFVMGTREEVDQAMIDYRAGRLVRTRAARLAT
ncbi:MAG: pirin family protein [Gallionellaceae bacterium]|nr:pirin family protein [Gallionellaceae bacterium]